jgi:hypothetical protein
MVLRKMKGKNGRWAGLGQDGDLPMGGGGG